jgi:cellobiose phosphorylase
MSGEIPLEGGWRVYSSGSGIAVRLIMQCFLGLRLETSALVVDPVITPDLDGLTARLTIGSHLIEVVYRTGQNGCGPMVIDLNGTALDFIRESNPYRLAGVRIPMASWSGLLTDKGNRLAISMA